MIAEDIANKLQTEGVGTVATDIFVSHLPPSPDNAIGVMDTGGLEPDNDLPLEFYTFQILIRNKVYDTGLSKLQAIRAALQELSNVTLGTTYVYFILAQAEGGHIGRDENNREVFSINFRCKVR